MILILILINFEWRDTENQQYKCIYLFILYDVYLYLVLFADRVVWEWCPVLFHISQMVASVERLHFRSDSVLLDHSTSHQHRKRAPIGPNSSKHLQHDNSTIQLVSHCSNNCNCISCHKTEKRRGAQRNRRRRN